MQPTCLSTSRTLSQESAMSLYSASPTSSIALTTPFPSPDTALILPPIDAPSLPQAPDTNEPDDGTKRYPCLRCPRRFQRSHDLSRHVRTVHLEVKPHRCRYCGKRFSRRDSLNKHLTVELRAKARADLASAAVTDADRGEADEMEDGDGVEGWEVRSEGGPLASSSRSYDDGSGSGSHSQEPRDEAQARRGASDAAGRITRRRGRTHPGTSRRSSEASGWPLSLASRPGDLFARFRESIAASAGAVGAGQGLAGLDTVPPNGDHALASVTSQPAGQEATSQNPVTLAFSLFADSDVGQRDPCDERNRRDGSA
ncbi:hypothetical protein HDU96_004473 [Phlyctochytrium bullatum]|nr:hypothetical protein HDU96_004473 [Phlyctochytrium bullatum]